MSNQIVISSGAKVRSLEGVLTGTAGIVNALGINVANGIPQLDGSGKILVSQLPNSVMEYKGTWNAATNTPTLVNGTGNQGDVYLCNVAGTTDFGAGPITFFVGDQVIYSGTIWQRASGATGTVTSVAVTESGDALTITGSPITTSGTINIGFAGISGQYINGAGGLTTFPTLISSIGLSMPSAFSVANIPLTANGTIAVTGAGVASQYIRGDGTLANFPTSGGGGGSVSYYLNGSVNQGTFGGNTYYEMGKVPVIGAGTDFTINADGYISQFITDAGDPALLEIPAGNWNFEMYFSASSAGGTPSFYVELYKYNGSTFTLISSSSATPEGITGGTAIDLYTTALAVPTTALTLTDRLAVRIYVTHSGRTITLHTEDNHLCQVITTFSTGITALNGLTAQVQFLATGTSGTDFNISSTTATHTFNLPIASATNTGKLSSTDWSTFNSKQPAGNYVTLDTTQTITSVKTFDEGLSLKSGAFPTPATGYSSLGGNAFGITIITKQSSTIYTSNLGFPSANRTFTFPNADGTIALTTDISYPVTSVFGRTGAVVATEGDYSLTQLSDVTITSPTNGQVLKYNGTSWVNDTDANTGTVTSVDMSVPTGLSVSGSPITSSGTLAVSFSAGYSIPTNVKQSNWDDAYTFVAAFPTQTGNAGKYLTTNGSSLSWADNPLGTVTSVGLSSATSGVTIGSSPITTSGTITLSIATASGSQNGLLSSTDWTTFNSKGNGTVTSVAALTLGTTGTDLSSSVANGTTTPVITLNVPTASATNRGALSSADWTTFNNKANALSGTINTIAYWDSATTIASLDLATYPSLTELSYVKGVTSAIQTQLNAKQGTLTLTTTGTSGAATLVGDTLNIPQYSGGGGGSISLAAIGSTPNANAATLTGTVLNLEPASASFGGVVTTGTQTFAGAKTFSSTLSAMGTNIQFNLDGTFGTNYYTMGFGGVSNGFNRIAGGTGTTDGLYITSATGRDIAFRTNGSGTTSLLINSTGNVGIGTTTVGSKLQVNGSAAIGYSASTAAPTNGLQVSGDVIFQSKLTINNGIYVGAASSGSGSFPLYFNNTSNAASRSWRMYIDGAVFGDFQLQQSTTQTGSVFANILYFNATGAATFASSITATQLNINGGASTTYGAFNTTTNGFAYLKFDYTGTTYGYIGQNSAFTSGGSTNSFQLVAVNDFRISTGGLANLRLFIDSSGNTTIGSASLGGSKFQVNGNAAIGYSASTAAPTNGLAVSGNVGVGTTSIGNFSSVTFTGPFLDVAGVLQIKGTAANTVAILQFGGDTWRKANIFTPVGTTLPYLGFGVGTSGSSSAANEVMRLTDVGNLGIGTTTIGSKLQVNGSAAIGYSASTTAPSNGLAVSGRILVNTTTDNGQGVLQANGGITALNVSLTGEAVSATTTFNGTYYKIITAGTSAAQTFTLPSPTSNNYQYVVVNKSSFPQTISAGTGFTIFDMTGANSATITLVANGRCFIIADGSGFYQIF